MPKIKVTKEIKEYEGNVEEKVATPFGTSAHINVGKKHTGKIMPLITPTNPEYNWVLPSTDLTKVERECNKILSKETGRLVHLKKQAVKKLADRFFIEDLAKVIKILSKDKKNASLIKKIKQTYSL
jgi:putative transposon-encoded protein